MLAAIIDGVHLLAVLGFIAGLLVILMATTANLSHQDLRAINRVYILAGLALAVAALAGSLLWLAVGKPAEFYSNNPVFHAKLGLFALLVALFVYTGTRFRQLQNRAQASASSNDETEVVVSDALRRMQKICIPLIIVIPALAWMMARGIGY